ncbi:MAG: cation-translocating P-type ATPase [Nitrospirae bacterium]|nr:cation-translocating P-type ATPase [Nitrospirota bacterium]
MNYHQKKSEDVLSALATSANGLSNSEAAKRLLEYGPNEIKEAARRTPLGMFLDQFRDFMIIILIVAAIISGLLGEVADTIAIVVIVILNAIMGFVQEYRAEKAIEALRLMATPASTVLREGVPHSVPTHEVVPGDVILLEAGKVVPADLRLIESAQIKIEEAALTGESVPVEKNIAPLYEEMVPLGDRRNMAYKGTIVSYGHGKGVVVATGMKTELGRIATMLQEEEEVKTPLQKRLAKFGSKLAIAVMVICAIVFGIGILRGEPPILMFLTAVSLAVAAIPEALPAVVTISLALGAKKLVKQNALIRKLPAVETLGSVTYICSDKTGTLTLNKMTVEEIYADGKLWKKGTDEFPRLDMLLTALSLNNDTHCDAKGTVVGDPTEIALYNIAKEKGFDKHETGDKFKRIGEIPFDSDRKCMTTFHTGLHEGKVVSFTKGAVDVLMDKSENLLTSDGRKPIDLATIHRINERMAADGLRVLGVAMRLWDTMPSSLSVDDVEDKLTLLGFVGMMDPPRAEARDAVTICREAGIRPVMITGDHPITARTIAGRIGIMDHDGDVMTGARLERMPMEDFEARVEHISAYARVAPEQKLKIVKALQDKGQYVAMTGDGVNDAPALKRADIGVAMGITGTDVSKEAAHMILLDDNFATIVKAIKEGREIFDNIRKFIKYVLTSNAGEVWTLFLAPFMGLPIPLLPIHLLWINLVTDGLPGLALTAEPAEKDVMKRHPRHPQESIFAHGLGAHILWVGFLLGSVTIFTQAWAYYTGHAHWQTMVFTVLCLSQMGHVLAIRSEKESLFSQGILSNKPLLGAVLLTFVLQLLTIYVPFLNPVFKTEPLSLSELLFALAMSSILFVAVEIEKWFKRRKEARRGENS